MPSGVLRRALGGRGAQIEGLMDPIEQWFTQWRALAAIQKTI
jgi:hypothetical protein